MVHVTITTPLSGMVCHRWAGTTHEQAVYQIWNRYIHPLRRYERRQKVQKLGWFGAWGHSRSSAT